LEQRFDAVDSLGGRLNENALGRSSKMELFATRRFFNEISQKLGKKAILVLDVHGCLFCDLPDEGAHFVRASDP
jgi:hypothetical protein